MVARICELRFRQESTNLISIPKTHSDFSLFTILGQSVAGGALWELPGVGCLTGLGIHRLKAPSQGLRGPEVLSRVLLHTC